MVPEITVVVPYFNEQETIGFTLRRIAEQTLPAMAAIFVNSSSTDNTSAIVDAWIAENQSHYRTKFQNVFAHSSTPSSSKNAGVRLATTEWLAFMDCGQNFQVDWLERQYVFSQERTLDVVSGVVYATGTNWVDRCAVAQTYGYRRKRPCLPSTLLRRHIFDDIGLFPEGRRAGYDAAWLLRLKKSGIERGVNANAVIEYIGVNFSSTLRHLYLKSALYAKPSVGLQGYHTPYAYAALPFVLLTLLWLEPMAALPLGAGYVAARSLAIPILKSRGLALFRESPLAAWSALGLVGLVLDCGRLAGTWQGILNRRA